MGKKHRNLIGRIADRDNLLQAYENAARGKRRSLGYLMFKEHLGANLAQLQSEILDGSYAPGPYRCFMVHEPKTREVAALPFYDRVAQHALCNIIEPIFDVGFVPQSYACRRGKGTHAGAIAVQALMRRMGKHGPVFILKTDFAKYFASIDRAILHREIRRKISCHATLAMIEAITPPDGIGLPIGNLTSQLYANVFGNIFDRWLIDHGYPRFVRYMDDTVIFGHAPDALQLLRMGLEWFAETQGMRFSRWSISPAGRGVNFLGYRIFPTHKLLRRRSVVSAKHKLARLAGLKRERFLSAWLGHAAHADTHNLLTKMGVKP